MSKLIYVADDEHNIRELISSFLKNDGFEVVTFEDGETLLTTFLKTPSDMVIIDIMMPGMDGLTLCSKLREKCHVPIIIVSARDSELDRVTGIVMGSDDYLVKPFSPIELVARVKAIFRRIELEHQPTGATTSLSFGDMRINLLTREFYIQDEKISLTPTEYSLMAYLIQHAGRAISREELLKNVWQYDFDIDTRATDDVVKRLRKKISHSSVHIQSVWGFGFKLEVANEKPKK